MRNSEEEKEIYDGFSGRIQHASVRASVSAHSPSEVARSLPPECVEKGLNGAGECVVSEIDLVISYARASGSDDRREGKVAKNWSFC